MKKTLEKVYRELAVKMFDASNKETSVTQDIDTLFGEQIETSQKYYDKKINELRSFYEKRISNAKQ